tara:strand:+ start:99 stop:950 length:852 start_codon:yes stop_codon:yes gene_type:complete
LRFEIKLLGYPLEHSISPIFQKVALDSCGIEADYIACPVSESMLPNEVQKIREDGCLGANVTIPYKEKIIPMLDTIDSVASKLGAVNTIVKQNDKLIGYNTDIFGFTKGLIEHGRFKPTGKKAMIFGAGGAARAAAFALANQNVDRMTIINRNYERARLLSNELRNNGFSCYAQALDYEDLQSVVEQSDLIVNSTPIGMGKHPEENVSILTSNQLRRDIYVYDLVYSPIETPLIQQAKAAGAKTLGGLPMLIYQGASSFTMWTSCEAPVELMFEAANKTLNIK